MGEKCSTTTYLPQRVAQSRSSSDATAKPALTSGTLSLLRAMAAAAGAALSLYSLCSSRQKWGAVICVAFARLKKEQSGVVWIGHAWISKASGKL